MNCIQQNHQEESFDSSPTTEFEPSDPDDSQSVKSPAHSLNLCVPYMLLSDHSNEQQDPKYEIQELYISAYKFPPINIYHTCEDDQPYDEETHITESQHPSIFSRRKLSSGTLPPKSKQSSEESLPPKRYCGCDNFNRILGEIFPPDIPEQKSHQSGFHEKIVPEILSVEKLRKSSSHDSKSPRKSSSIKGVDQQQQTIVAVKDSKAERKHSLSKSGAKIYQIESEKDDVISQSTKSVSFSESKNGKSTGDNTSLSVAPLDPSSLKELLSAGAVSHKNCIEMKDSNIAISKYGDLNSPKTFKTVGTSKHNKMTQSNSNYTLHGSSGPSFRDPNLAVRRHSDSQSLKKRSSHSQATQFCSNTTCPYGRDVGTENGDAFRKSRSNKTQKPESGHYKCKSASNSSRNVGVEKKRSSGSRHHRSNETSFINSEVEMENHKFSGDVVYRCKSRDVNRCDKATNRQKLSSGSLPPKSKQPSEESLPPKRNYGYDNFNRILGEIFPPDIPEQKFHQSGFQEKIVPEILSVEKLKKSSSHDSKSPRKSSSIKGVDQQQQTIEAVKASKAEKKHSLSISSTEICQIESEKDDVKSQSTKVKSTGDNTSLSVAPLDPSSIKELLSGGVVSHTNCIEIKDSNLAISKYGDLYSPKTCKTVGTSKHNKMTQNCSNYTLHGSSGPSFKDPNLVVRRHSDSQSLKKRSSHSQATQFCSNTTCPYRRDVGTENGDGFRKSRSNRSNSSRSVGVEMKRSSGSKHHRSNETSSINSEVEMENHKFSGAVMYRCKSHIVNRCDKATNRPSKNFHIHKEVIHIRSMSTQDSHNQSSNNTQYSVEPLKGSTPSNSESSKKHQSNQTGNGKQDKSSMPEDTTSVTRTLGVNTISIPETPKRKQKKKNTMFSSEKKITHKTCCCAQNHRVKCKSACKCQSAKKPGVIKSSDSRKFLNSTTIKTTESPKSLSSNKHSYRIKNRANQTGEHGTNNAYTKSEPIVTVEDGVQICAIKVNIVDRSRFDKEHKKGKNIFQSLFRIYHSNQVPRLKLPSIWPFHRSRKKFLEDGSAQQK